MKLQSYLDKSAWSDGPWKTEPDSAHWICAETSYVCSMRRNVFGTWTGFVGVDEDHPLFQMNNHGEEYRYIEVHGGVLTTDFNLEDDLLFTPPKRLWYVSFAAIHPNDAMPDQNLDSVMKAPKRKRKAAGDATYKNFEYMRGQVEMLAQQLSFFDARIS